MAAQIALCVDETTALHPELMGLEGERIDAQPWLEVYSGGLEARASIASSNHVSQAWVVSCDDVEPINLAASLKADRSDLHVCLVSSEVCGSLLSRAHNALIDEVLDLGLFVRRYADAKQTLQETPASSDSMGFTTTCVTDAERAAGGAITAAAIATAPAIDNQPKRVPTLQFPEIQPQPQPVAVRTASRAFVISVVSGSGGAGKSSVAALCAMIAHTSGHKTLLLDYDLQFGDVDTLVGVENALRIDEALRRPDLLERELAREGMLVVLAAPSRLEAAEEVVRQLPTLLDRLVDAFDVIVANTGACWAEQHAALLERSSAALFLVDQRASSVRACKHALELCARCGIATGPFQFALNRCAKGAPLTSVDVSCALQGAPVFELKDGGRDVEDYLSSGAASELIALRNEFVKSLEHVMKRLLPGGAIEASVLQTEPEPSRRSPLRRRRHSNRKDNRK